MFTAPLFLVTGNIARSASLQVFN